MTTLDTRDALLDTARELVQTRGYHGFSFRDVAEKVGIRTASVHYHFPTKTDLGRALVARQRGEVAEALARIDAEEEAAGRKLARYARVFRATLEDGDRMCLCGMLAADATTLDAGLVEDLRASFADHEAWLERVLADGRAAGALRFAGGPRDEARLLLASLEGAMLLARAFRDVRRYEAAARGALARLSAGG